MKILMRKALSTISILEKDRGVWVVLGIITLFVILRIPSLIEPYWYGDEGIYQVIGIALREGRLLYEGIWDNKPPLLYILYAIFYGDQFSLRALSLVFGVGAIIAFYILSSNLFKLRFSAYLATVVFALLFATPYLEGNIANAENFMLLFVLISAYLILKYQNNPKSSSIPFLISGVFVSLAFLTKIVGLFDFLAFFTFILFVKFDTVRTLPALIIQILKSFMRGDIFTFYKSELIFVAGFLVPVIIVSLYFLSMGIFNYYLQAVFLQNIGYVGYGNFFFFPLGFLGFKIALLIFSLSLVIFWRNRLSKPGLFIYIWIIFSTFNAFFSQRAYTHYLLVLLPSLALLIGLAIDHFKMRAVHATIAVALVILILNFFHPYRKIIPYYLNYFQFVTGSKSLTEYRSFFDRNTPRDYILSDFIKAFTRSSESVYLWSDSGQIYALSGKLPIGRYAVSYHVLSDRDGIEMLGRQVDQYRPKFIIATKNTSPINDILQSYQLIYIIDSALVYERQL